MTRRADAQTRHPARDFPIERRASNLLERGIDYFAQYGRSDYYVDRIFKMALADNFLIEQSIRVELRRRLRHKHSKFYSGACGKDIK